VIESTIGIAYGAILLVMLLAIVSRSPRVNALFQIILFVAFVAILGVILFGLGEWAVLNLDNP
jgi:hypothetical protein